MPIKDEFYITQIYEQEIGSGYEDEDYVEFVPTSSQDKIKRCVENGLKLDEDQEAQDSRDKKSGTIEALRRSQREQPDWFTYALMAEFAYSAVVDALLTFEEAIKSSNEKKWRASMEKKIDAHRRNKTWKYVR